MSLLSNYLKKKKELAKKLMQLRADGYTYDDLAIYLRTQEGLEVTGTQVRNWFKKLDNQYLLMQKDNELTQQQLENYINTIEQIKKLN